MMSAPPPSAITLTGTACPSAKQAVTAQENQSPVALPYAIEASTTGVQHGDNIAADEAALNDLEKLGYMTTPVTVIDGEVVVGFDAPKLRSLLQLGSG